MNGLFTIGELARRAGVNLQTIRYYERRKLLFPAERKASGYRFYDEGALKRLVFIRRAKELGFTLEEIRELLGLRVEPASSKEACERVKSKARAKMKSIENRIAALESVRKILKDLLNCCDKRRPTEECPILRAMEEKR
ncbi:MAG: heavy metal-responsive transcriptional regulator [Deltaproteobacteria bacterium]|nr:heavy metal-responsive transcriptional regulator [Deltaproteobacteria bacterium]